MKIVRLILCLLFVNMLFGVQAQRLEVKCGLNLSKTLYFNADTSIFTNRLPGFNAGLFYEFRLANSLYQTIGAAYSQRGYKVPGLDGYYKYRFNYIDVPINVLYKFDMDDVLFSFEIGPYAAIGLNGKVNYGNETRSIRFGKKASQLQKFDIGVNVGYSVEYENFIFSAYYYVGFINVSNSSPESIKNRSFCFSLGYIIE